MTASELADVWVPVPIRWRHVQAGDVIVGTDGRPFVVVELSPPVPPLTTIAVRVLRTRRDEWTGPVNPDDAVTVLMPATEHDAMTLMRDQLGAQLIERRTA